jgi:hypothetical protein
VGTIKGIALTDGTVVYIEMEEADVPDTTRAIGHGELPPGAEEVSAVDKAVDTMKKLQGTLQAFFETIRDSVGINPPEEWGAELNIGFKGTVNPIPVIVSGESSVAIKVHAKWVRPK